MTKQIEFDAESGLKVDYVVELFKGSMLQIDQKIDQFLKEVQKDVEGTDEAKSKSFSALQSLMVQQLMTEQSMTSQAATSIIKSIKDAIMATLRNIN